jgi:hypothetical protein
MADNPRTAALDERIEALKSTFAELLDALCSTSDLDVLEKRVGLLEEALFKQITAVSAAPELAMSLDPIGPNLHAFVQKHGDQHWEGYFKA